MMAIAVMVSSCSKSPYDKAVEHIENLDRQVITSTTMNEYEDVYQKVIALQSDPNLANLKNLTSSEKQTIVKKMTSLTLDALAVKAILYEMPDSIKPSKYDMKTLCNLCIDKKVNIMTPNFRYHEVRAIISDYYKAKQ